MKRISVIILAIICLLSMVTGCQPKNQPVTLTDDMGRTVTFDKVPERLISHVPSITEMLFALGLEEKIVGVDDYSVYPPEAKLITSVGNYWEPSIEKIVSLNPDLVLTDGHSQNITQLDSLGIKYLVIDPTDINGIYTDLTLLGKSINIEERAEALITQMKSEMDAVTAKTTNAARVKVFYVLDAKTDPNNPWTAGPDSFIDSLIKMSGGQNVAENAASAYAQFSIEQLVAEDPQIIILGNNHGTADVTLTDLQQNPVWSKLTAVKLGSVYAFNADLANPVPRITQGLAEIARIIHPELFE
jgi:iron complex transport system substrate-binding protein